MIVCHCRAVNHTVVLDAIQSGASDLDTVAATCGAGSVCGGCRPTIAAFMSGDSVAPSEIALSRPRRVRRAPAGIRVAPAG